MGYHHIPDKYDSEDDPAPLVIYGKDAHFKEATKSCNYLESLTSDEVTDIREGCGWNEFVSKEPHVALKLIEAVGVIIVSHRLTLLTDLPTYHFD